MTLPVLPEVVEEKIKRECTDDFYFASCETRVRDIAELCLREGALAGIPDGWQLVPKEPTSEMLNAGGKFSLTLRDTYRDMLNAAPEKP